MQFDQTRMGRTIKILNVVDEFTSEALVADLDASIDVNHAVRVLAGESGHPRYLRFDHGPAVIAYAVTDLSRFNRAETMFIGPGSPWQSGWIESLNGRMRHEHLNNQLV